MFIYYASWNIFISLIWKKINIKLSYKIKSLNIFISLIWKFVDDWFEIYLAKFNRRNVQNLKIIYEILTDYVSSIFVLGRQTCLWIKHL